MSVRGVAKHGATTFTSRFTGMFRDNPAEQAGFLSMVRTIFAGIFQLPPVSIPSDSSDTEEGLGLQPKFDAAGLVACVATDAGIGEVLMVAHMNAEALARPSRPGRPVFQPLPQCVLAKRRDFRAHPTRRRYAHRLRPGRHLDPGRAGPSPPATPAGAHVFTAR